MVIEATYVNTSPGAESTTVTILDRNSGKEYEVREEDWIAAKGSKPPCKSNFPLLSSMLPQSVFNEVDSFLTREDQLSLAKTNRKLQSMYKYDKGYRKTAVYDLEFFGKNYSAGGAFNTTERSYEFILKTFIELPIFIENSELLIDELYILSSKICNIDNITNEQLQVEISNTIKELTVVDSPSFAKRLTNCIRLGFTQKPKNQLAKKIPNLKQISNGIDPRYGGGFIIFDDGFNIGGIIHTGYAVTPSPSGSPPSLPEIYMLESVKDANDIETFIKSLQTQPQSPPNQKIDITKIVELINKTIHKLPAT
jgi:hypothetical protein